MFIAVGSALMTTELLAVHEPEGGTMQADGTELSVKSALQLDLKPHEISVQRVGNVGGAADIP